MKRPDTLKLIYDPEPPISFKYNRRFQCNHPNTETYKSPLNDPTQNVYLMLGKKKVKTYKKNFPNLTTGNNVELPEYLVLPELPPNKFSVDHLPKYQIGKKYFENKLARSEDEITLRRKKLSALAERMLSETKDSEPNKNYLSNREEYVKEYNRRYGVRNFDIISNNRVVPYEGQVGYQNNYFSNMVTMKTPRSSKDEIRRDLINRYRKLNGVGVEHLFKDELGTIRWVK